MKEKMERVGKEKARKTCVENIGTKVVKNSKGKRYQGRIRNIE